MKKQRILATLFALITALSISVPVVRANDWNQETRITFDDPVEIPGQILSPGTYRFVVFNSTSNRDIVQIFSEDRTVLYGTVQTVSAERQEPANTTLITLAERPSGNPEAILTWFFPGETRGHEFIYPRTEERELARDMHQTVAPDTSGY
jgi:hypothetical protein